MYEIAYSMVSISNQGCRWAGPFPWKLSQSKLAISQGGYGRWLLWTFYEFKIQNSILISEVFQIEVSHGMFHSLGSWQKVNFYPARVFAGGMGFVDLLYVQNSKCSRQCVFKIAYLLLKYFKLRFQVVWSIPLEVDKKQNCIQLRCLRGDGF